jgi:hypothetical protein
MEEYISNAEQCDDGYINLPLEAALILNGVLALAARFSTSSYFDNIPPASRGECFGRNAKAIYDDSIRELRKPTLKYVQGSTLLAFYLYSSEPDSQGWLAIGVCSRLAYDLGLNNVDEDYHRLSQIEILPSDEWSRREELRRAWWCVWELDAFASAIACRPPTIDKTKMQVMLPVSDESWFANTPVESAIIDPSAAHAWHTLQNCQNQDVRAWFLVTNFLLLLTHDLGQQKNIAPQEFKAIETAVACFALLLPPEFHLNLSNLSFIGENYHRSNWILSLNIMLQG